MWRRSTSCRCLWQRGKGTGANLRDEGKGTDRRARYRREERRLLWAIVAFVVVGGGAAIALAYGPPAVALGLACLVAGAGILAALWLILWLMERLSKD